MGDVLPVVFGAKAQVVVGTVMVAVTVAQTAYWLLITPPTVMAVFLVSMEALLFAGYGVISTGLGYRATERVENVVVEAVDQMDVDVDVNNNK